jgi:hypothetical protein
MEAYATGMTDAQVTQMTGGRYKTIDNYFIARANFEFGLQVYEYDVIDGIIAQFTRCFATTLVHNENERRIGGLNYTRTDTDLFGFDRHYLLETRNFNNARAQLNNFLGSMPFNTNYNPSSDLGRIRNIGDIILSEVDTAYVLVQHVEVDLETWTGHFTWRQDLNSYVGWSGVYWHRLNF